MREFSKLDDRTFGGYSLLTEPLSQEVQDAIKVINTHFLGNMRILYKEMSEDTRLALEPELGHITHPYSIGWKVTAPTEVKL